MLLLLYAVDHLTSVKDKVNSNAELGTLLQREVFQNRDQYSTNELWGFTMDTNLFLTSQILRLGFEIRFLKFNE